MSRINRTLSKYLGVDAGREQRRERLDSLPQYDVVDLRCGGLIIIHHDGDDGREFQTENTKAAMQRMGVCDE